MKRYLNHIIRSWRSHGVVQFTTCIVLSGVFSVVGTSLLIHQNLKHIFEQWGDSVQVSVYLKDQIDDGSLDEIRKFITGSEYFRDVQYISKEAAFENFSNQTFEYMPSFVFDKDFGNPLPASFEMKATGDLSSSAHLGKIKEFVQELKTVDGIDSIMYGQEWIDNYASFLQGFSYISGSFIIVLLAGSLFVIGNSIRSSMSQRQQEIEIFELVGATPSFIRRPYIVDGLFTGLLAAIVSIVICYLLFLWQSQALQDYGSLWKVSFSFFNTPTILILLSVGLFLGGVGAWLCVAQINSGWAATRGSKT